MQTQLNAFELAESLCSQHNCRLLYAARFGSALYGTAIPGKSDTDIRGVFLPDIDEALLGKAPARLHFSTGNAHARNTSADLDIDLCSLNKWLLNLLPQGDIGALDLLFSHTSQDSVIFCEPFMGRIFQNPLPFINIDGQKSYFIYSMRQARKYGIQGSWLGTIKKICLWLDSLSWKEEERLEKHLDDLLAHCADARYCRETICGAERAAVICDRIYPASRRMEEFSKHIRALYDAHGARAKAAMSGNDVDWKALSHAVRALEQIKELAQTGSIHFPLKKAAEIMKIKKGEYSWPEVERIILEKLAEAEKARDNSPYAFECDMKLAEKTVLDAYNFYYGK